MAFLGARWIEGVRSLLGQLHDSQILVLRKSMEANSIGGVSDLWSEVARVAGRLTRLRQQDYYTFHGDQQIAVSAWGAYTAPDADIRIGDRLRVGGRTFSVIGTDGGRTDALTQLVRLLEER